MNLSVGDVARLSGVTVRTLHHYDEIGLLSPSGRTPAGYRRYSERDVDRLQRILFYRELGFSLAKIRDILDDSGADAVGDLRTQHALLVARAERMQAMASAALRALDAHEKGETMTAEEKLGIFGSYGREDLVDPSPGQQFADALNAGDLEGAVAFVAEDAVWYVDGDGEYAGPTGVLELLQKLAAQDKIGKITDVCVSDVHLVLMGAGWPSGRGEWIAHAAGDKLGVTYLAV